MDAMAIRMDDLGNILRKALFHAELLELRAAVSPREAVALLNGWLHGAPPAQQEVEALLTVARQRIRQWERVEEAALGVAVRLRAAERAAEAQAAGAGTRWP